MEDALTHISLCTGYGGIDLGLNRVLQNNIKTLAYSEIEAFAIYNLLSKMESGFFESAPIWPNLKTFPWHLFKGKTSILSGGFPCQPFSVAGAKVADEDPRHLWPFIMKGIEALEFPHLLFFENVQGIVNTTLKCSDWADPEGTPVLLHILRELNRYGYDVTWGLFSARMVGSPQNRKRIFILAKHRTMPKSSQDIVSKHLKFPDRQSGVWPSAPQSPQKPWEPPRVLTKTITSDLKAHNQAFEKYGTMPIWDKSVSENDVVFNRGQELRLLGNGVLPQCAQLAFAHLWNELLEAN